MLYALDAGLLQRAFVTAGLRLVRLLGYQAAEDEDEQGPEVGFPTPMHPRCLEVYVEGTVGVGKSTLLEEIKKLMKTNADVFPEPVLDWESVLARFYADPSKHALALQMRVLSSFLERGRGEAPVRVFERSPVACRYVFGHLLLHDNAMHPDDATTFNRFYDHIIGENRKLPFCIYVYLDAPTSIQRVAARSRTSETDIDEDYLMRLHKQYMTFVKINDMHSLRETGLSWAESPHMAKAIAIDGSRKPEDVARLAIKAINLFMEYV